MNLKEKLDIAFKFTALAVFALLVSNAFDHKSQCMNHKSQCMNGEFHFRGDISKKIAMGKDHMMIFEIDDDSELKKMKVEIQKEIIDGEEKVKITVNGKEISEEELAKFKDENHNIMKWKTEDGKQIIMKKKMMKELK
jgi:hypothetical protein